jgi:cephalosporin hydroxylase
MDSIEECCCVPDPSLTSSFTYQDIPGWFDFDDIYDEIVKKARQTAVFVEVGSWQGRSTAYLADAVVRSGKTIALYAVDIWDDRYKDPAYAEEMARLKRPLYQIFRDNMRQCGVDGLVRAMKMPSELAARQFADESLDFVFIDADHSYEGVSRDIRAWYPKVRPFGYIGGHDHTDYWPGVKQAVAEFFASPAWFPPSPSERKRYEVRRSSWLHHKQVPRPDQK